MSNTNQGTDSKPTPLYRRFDSKAECYRKATVTGMKTPHRAFIAPKVFAIPREEPDDDLQE
jgi:hypothetical protein